METQNIDTASVFKPHTGLPFPVRNLLNSILKGINQIEKNPIEQIKVPDLCVILGSGFGGKILSDEKESLIIPYSKLDGFPQTTVEGHAGRLVINETQGKRVIFLDGRKHFYEGAPLEEIVRPVRALASWGVQNFLITNSVGGMNLTYSPGDFMVIEDHINKMGVSPIFGKNNEALGVRFPDMSKAYSEKLMNVAKQAANEVKMVLHKGKYVAVPGPQFETPAEVVYLRNSTKADAVGMSVVPEVIALNHMKHYKKEDGSKGIRDIQILGFSCVSNKAAGLDEKSLTHEDVMETGEKNSDLFQKWLSEFIKLI